MPSTKAKTKSMPFAIGEVQPVRSSTKKLRRLTKEQVASRTAFTESSRDRKERVDALSSAGGLKRKLVDKTKRRSAKRRAKSESASRTDANALNKGTIKARKFGAVLTRVARDEGRKVSKRGDAYDDKAHARALKTADALFEIYPPTTNKKNRRKRTKDNGPNPFR